MILRHLISSLAILLLVGNSVNAQTSTYPWKAGVSATFLDYQGMLSGDFFQFKTFDPGIQFGAHAYLNRALNVSIQSAFVPEAMYPTSEDHFVGTSLIDVNGLIQFKSNGTFLDEEAVFAPYLSLGIGVNAANNIVRPYIPAALGFRIRISPTFSLQFESMYKQRLGAGQYQHVAHTAGFVFALPTQKKPEPKKQTTARNGKKQNNLTTFSDRDKDGVADKDDLCPDVKGLAMYLGCPERDKEEPKEEDRVEYAVNNEALENLTIKDSQPQPARVMDTHRANLSDLQTEQPEAKLIPKSEGHDDIRLEDLNYLEAAMNNVYFEFASKELAPASYPVLDTIAMILEKYPEYDLHVQGHTDNEGSMTANQILSVKRAFQVKYYLVYEKGVRLSRISSEGYNSTSPIADNGTPEGRSRNRRVEFKLYKRTAEVVQIN